MEVSEYLVGSPAFKAGGTGDPRTAGSIPVHLRHSLAALALIIVVVVAGSPNAGAVARLLSSSPADGGSVEELDVIEFDFDTLLLEEGASIDVARTNGALLEVEPAVVDGTTLRTRSVELVPPGTYAISYSVLSADGARNNGSIRVDVALGDQAFAGGLLIVIVIAAALGLVLLLAFRADRRGYRAGHGRRAKSRDR